ncbi:MAG TPA: NAD-dependent epimerase/dehydratase family protein [Candidatus Acidoferrales bacterium]|jgi:2'-hydroxyisoflavone reductase|nr:NAD-dependent epimerase/dehydratase family protein [Candidatus Acidoferrales bacterium]
MHRRQFLKAGASAAISSVLGASPAHLLAAQPKRILVLGGTLFAGPALVEAAINGGHSVTLFNRGVTNPHLFPYVEKLRGFRSADSAEENFASLGSRTWDAVVDVWPYDPNVVASAAKLLVPRAAHYLFISSIGAYDSKGYATPGLTEEAALTPLTSISEYKRGKAESERRLQAIAASKLTIVRPGPIKGARDSATDLYTWLMRCRAGGKHIGPGDGNEYVQMVDVKDVARFLVAAIEQQILGTYNLTGRPFAFSEFLQACNKTTRSDADFVWIPRDFLKSHGVPLTEGNFPLWRPDPSNHAIFQISSQKAFKAGWQIRPFQETVMDCLSFFNSMDPTTFLWQDPLARAQELEVITAWETRAG